LRIWKWSVLTCPLEWKIYSWSKCRYNSKGARRGV
jgi:hypothetical protein